LDRFYCDPAQVGREKPFPTLHAVRRVGGRYVLTSASAVSATPALRCPHPPTHARCPMNRDGFPLKPLRRPMARSEGTTAKHKHPWRSTKMWPWLLLSLAPMVLMIGVGASSRLSARATEVSISSQFRPTLCGGRRSGGTCECPTALRRLTYQPSPRLLE
jgi:hypothetical protein